MSPFHPECAITTDYLHTATDVEWYVTGDKGCWWPKVRGIAFDAKWERIGETEREYRLARDLDGPCRNGPEPRLQIRILGSARDAKPG